MKRILELIKKYDTIILHSHIRPDGDSIGSQYGLKYLIENSFPNKLVYISGTSSEYLNFIGKPYLIDENIFKNALSICLDSANYERLSDKRYNLSDYSIKIDHHIKDKEYCNYEYIDDSSSSTAQIITEFYMAHKNELKMTKECATALYVGLITDSGNFTYPSVNAKTFECASELIDYVDLNYINKNLSKESINLLKFKGYCLENFKTTKNGLIYLKITKDIMKEFNVTEEETASLVNILSTLEEYPMWIMFIETDLEIRVRLRSKGPDVNKFAKKYNGGGHKLASGAKLKDWNSLDKFILDADKYIKKYKEDII